MIKVIILLCAMATALVCAKPSGKQEESIVATDGRSFNVTDVTGRVSLFAGTHCDGKKHIFSCDGTCFNIYDAPDSLLVCF